MIDRLGNVIAELRERRAIRFLVGYLVGAWITAQIAGFFVEQGYVGRRVLDVTLFLAVVFFFLSVVLVWYHGEKGQQKVQRLEGFIIGTLLLIGATGSAWIATREAGSGFGGVEAIYDLGESSIAVLPFQNQITSAELEWLDRGIADLLATDLAQFDTLRVVSGQRVFDIMRQLGVVDSRTVPEDLQTEVTERAGARFMLTGSIIGSPGNLQIVATLSDVRTGDIRASARARGDDVFALVDEVSAAISTDLLGRGISSVEKAPVAQLTTSSIEALREFDLGSSATWEGLYSEAREHLERAIELDPTFSAANAQLAMLLFRFGDIGSATEALQQANRHLATASERDRLFVGGFSDVVFGRPEDGEAKFRELLAKYPYEKDVRIIFGGLLSQFGGDQEEIERLTLETVQLDPFYGLGWNQLAYRYANRGDFVGADTLIQKYIDLEPDSPNPLDSKGEILEMAGKIEEARDAYRSALALREDFAVGLGHLARSYRRERRYADSRAAVAPYRTSEFADTRMWAWWLTADALMFEGDVPGALATYDSLIAVTEALNRPDLHALTLDGMIRTLILLERYGEAVRYAASLDRVRGPDGITEVARLHDLGASGRFDEMERLRLQSLESARETGLPPQFLRVAEGATEMVIEYYRGDHARVVEIINDLREGSNFPVTQLGYPSIRSALEVGDVETAKQGTRAMMAGTLAPQFHTAPLVLRARDYFEGRIAELEGDTVRARAEYDDLIDLMGDGLADVPLFADVRSRRAALAGS